MKNLEIVHTKEGGRLMLIIIYWVLGYMAYGYVNRDKVYYYSYGQLFKHKLTIGLILGWFYIPSAILKMVFGR